ncbi:MAG: N-acetyl-gamma-glutamyl-phosphate reductase [bacterium]
MIKVGVIGAGGYAGITLIQILLQHPEVKIDYLMSEEAHVGKTIDQLYPHLLGACNIKIEKTGAKKADVVFLALPHGISQDIIPDILKTGARVIDLGADYRFNDEPVYKKWYHDDHKTPELLKEAVFGSPELYREQIKKAKLIGNPGCYPTSAILALAPLAKQGIIDLSNVVVDSKSGTSGAGRGANMKTIYCERNEGIEGYAVTNHRHMGEIEYQVARVSGDQGTRVTFVPHLMPMTRGILSTIYAKLLKKVDLVKIYKDFYKNEPFVRIREGSLPNTKFVAGTNFCDIAVQVNEGTGQVVILSAIDNLVKGASGQAVQNMNIMFGFEETAGLKQLALYP